MCELFIAKIWYFFWTIWMQESSLLLFSFNGEKEKEWHLNSAIRYLKVSFHLQFTNKAFVFCCEHTFSNIYFCLLPLNWPFYCHVNIHFTFHWSDSYVVRSACTISCVSAKEEDYLCWYRVNMMVTLGTIAWIVDKWRTYDSAIQ